MVDLAGQDATEAYDDAGHSDEAHEILTDLHVGQLRCATNGAEKNKGIDALKSTYTDIRREVIQIQGNSICSVPSKLQSFLTPDSFQETELITKTVISRNVAM